MGRVEEIDNMILYLIDKMGSVKGTECERFARITGFFQPISQWNKGKKEEWKGRREYKLDK